MRRIKRADTFAGSAAFPTSRPLKRAPSFGASSRGSLESIAMSIDFNDARDSDVTSDEEEKVRRRKAKKARTKASSPPHTSIPLTPSKPIRQSTPTNVAPSVSVSKGTPTAKEHKPAALNRSAKPRANVRRNPSILGPELPNPQPNLEPPASIRSAYSPYPKPIKVVRSPTRTTDSPCSLMNATPTTPQTQPIRSLKRTKASTALSRRPPARKISFGSIIPPAEDVVGAGAGLGLGSAFQLR